MSFPKGISKPQQSVEEGRRLARCSFKEKWRERFQEENTSSPSGKWSKGERMFPGGGGNFREFGGS